ncbi:MAG: enoyl-CoA hydratase-related protein [Butyricicoccus sp.]|nr:enoyl-CoA hydratase-related protein [Butyricicoccus sp.]
MAFVDLEQRGSIGILTMNRPEALNALNDQVLRDLDAALDAVEANDEILVVILTGAGRSFVAGADIGQMKDFTSVQAKKFGAYGNSVFLKLENFPKPVIAAVNGFALGGGCELAMSCDIRLASENASFGQPEVGLGITPGCGGTQRLARFVGAGKAKEMLYTARANYTAQDALDMGLVNYVYPLENLLDEAVKLAEEIAAQAPIAVSLVKEAVNVGMQTDLNSALKFEGNCFAQCFATEDQKYGMAYFLDKNRDKPAKEFKNK